MGTKVTEPRARYDVPGQPAEPPDELDLLRNMGLRLLVAEVDRRWWRDQADCWQEQADWWRALAVSILLAWAVTMKEREDNERE